MNTIDALTWYFRDSALDSEIPFLLGSLPTVDDAIPEGAFRVDPITRARGIRNTLLSMAQPHADVLSWMFETREHPTRLHTLFSWPGVAMRTEAARLALDADETFIVMQTADAPLCRWPLTPGNEHGMWADSIRTFEYAPTEIVTGDHDSRGGMVGFLIGLKPGSKVVATIQAETSRRVNDAMLAFDVARGERRAA